MKHFILLVGLLGFVVGCGPGGNVVTGKVTLDDGTSAPRGGVILRNDAATFQGAIGSDGTYTIENVAAGTYGVAVVGVTEGEIDPQAGMAFDQNTGQYTGSAAPAPKELIKATYFNPTTSGLSLTVPSESYDLKVERDTGSGGPSSGASS